MLKIYLLITVIIFAFTIFDTNGFPQSSNNLYDFLPKIEGRIISGSKAQSGQFPWQVLIKRYENDDLYCGGSILSPDYVLTAAHCTEGLKSVYLIFGVTNLKETPEIALTSSEIYTHENYVSEFLNNDISIIKLPKSLKLSDKIKPLNLLSRTDANDLFVNRNVIISGWGFTSDEELEYSQDLLFASLTVITNEKCRETFNESYVLDSNLCAVGSQNNFESICNGDSGGPLVLEKSPGNFIQIGINSFVLKEICAEGEPAGFVRLGSYLDFIEKITGIKT